MTHCENTNIPLVVDLDGTIIFTDMLHESAIAYIGQRPFDILNIFRWLRHGKAYLKEQLSVSTSIDTKLLPYNNDVIEFLKSEKAKGRKIVLCTATHHSIANNIADFLGLFSEVIATQKCCNVISEAKAQILVSKYGDKNFDYIGNSKEDIPVWKHARRAIIANASKSVEKKAAQIGNVDKTFHANRISLRNFTKAIRLHQWLKNMLVFVPALAAHALTNPDVLGLSVMAFIAFSLCASAIYLINDLVDITNDRKHPSKRKRPIASGKMSILTACYCIPVLLSTALMLTSWIGAQFTLTLSCYIVITICYSFWIKQILLLDCIVLAILYTIRVLAGGAATDIEISQWLFTFSIFIFLSLAYVKRHAEITLLLERGKKNSYGRAYVASDLPILQSLGVTSGYISILVLALYINSPSVCNLYRSPEFLWLIVPVLVFWVSWMWLKSHRGEMHDDPVFFAIKDKASLSCGMIFVGIFLAACML